MESNKVNFYSATYEEFAAQVYAEVRRKAFGVDIGQNGWLTADEHDQFLNWLNLTQSSKLLDVACGSGGPTLRAAQLRSCEVYGIDIHEHAIKTAKAQAAQSGFGGKAIFEQVDANQPLPFADATFDAVICVDAINHLPDRRKVLREWLRVLKPKGRLVFTDPIVVTGSLTNEEIGIRGSIGFFLFVPSGFDEALLKETGFKLIESEDHTENMAVMARKWREAREERANDLRKIEGDETFNGQQRFFSVASQLAEERRLSRYAFCAERSN